MHNIKLTLAYDGTDFRGWQIQPGQPTVQGLLAETLGKITQERVILHGAGRTDAGVHAWGQVASFKTPKEMPADEFMRALNALLPASVRIRDAAEVGPSFHARWQAEAKTYHYRIYRGTVVPPWLHRYVLHDPYPLDFEAMAEAARLFEGEHDFTTFVASTGSEEVDRERTMVRRIFRSEMVRLTPAAKCERVPFLGMGEGGEWVYVVRGRSFMRNMVRKIVGTLHDVGRGRISPADIPCLIESRDRSRSGMTAWAQGLCLMSVEYPDPENSLPESSRRKIQT
jgi:tRNA pseudouridine38-40 synthase